MIIKLVRGSSYKLPLSKRSVMHGETVKISDVEWEDLKATGRFLIVSQTDDVAPTEAVEEIPGLTVIKNLRRPSALLPEDWTGKKILVKIMGGIGDAVVCTGVARSLKTKPCSVVYAVAEQQIALISSFEGIGKAVKIEMCNDPHFKAQFDIFIDLNFAFSDGRQVVDKEYYEAVHSKAGTREAGIHTGRLLLSRTQMKNLRVRMPKKRPLVALHCGSSNPVRRWDIAKWHQLAYRIVAAGGSVIWLGPKSKTSTGDYYGITDNQMVEASDIASNLLDQAAILYQCDFFVGNDSAFAHLAGVMGITGLVLFSSSKPEHVIKRYKTLRAVQVYDSLEVEPSRTLRSVDPIAKKCMDAITVDMVFDRIDARLFAGSKDANVCTLRRVCPTGRKSKILAANDLDVWSELSQWFDIDVAKTAKIELRQQVMTFEYDAVLVDGKSKQTVESAIGNLNLHPTIVEIEDGPIQTRKSLRSAMGKTAPDKVQFGTIRVVNRNLGVGDTIMATSLLAKLREMYPQATIEFCGSELNNSVLVGNDDVNRTITLEQEKESNADYVIELAFYGCWERGQHITEAMGGDKNSLKVTAPSIPIEVPSPSVGFFMYQAPGGFKSKEWPTKKWAELAGRLYDHGIGCYQLGAPFEEKHDFLTDWREDGLDRLFAKINALDTIVCVEGLANHAAKALGKTAVVLFGGGSTVELAGYESNVNVVTKSPHRCWTNVCGSTLGLGGCCIKEVRTDKSMDFPCINEVSVDDVFKAVQSVLREKHAPCLSVPG